MGLFIKDLLKSVLLNYSKALGDKLFKFRDKLTIMESELEKIIIKKLNSIEEDLTYIKHHMMEKEDVLSEEEFNAYIRSFDKENLVTLKDVKKQLGI